MITPARVGFVGAGTWMRTYHLPAARYLADRGELVLCGICNRTREKAETAAREFGIEKIFSSPQELLGDPLLDGVVVAVARQYTPRVLREAARCGVPVLVEKPPADSVAEMRDLIPHAGVRNIVAFNRLFTPLLAQVRETALRIEPYHLACRFSRRRRDDPRFVTETGIHALANVDWLFGPGELQQAWRVTKQSGVFWWSARVSYAPSECAPSGLLAEYHFLPWSGRAVERYEFSGRTGTVEFHTRQHYAPDDVEELLESSDHEGALVERRWAPPPGMHELERAGYLGEHRAFLQMIRATDAKAPADGPFDLRRTLRVMELAEAIEGA